MIIDLSRIREWNHRRLEKRHRYQPLSGRVDQLENQLKNLAQAVADPHGLSMAYLRMRLLHCPERYEYLLCAVPEGRLVIDGGANLGLFSDLMLGLGATVVAFEPNPVLYRHLERKYFKHKKLQVDCASRLTLSSPGLLEIRQEAISINDELLQFSMPNSGSFIGQSQGGSIENLDSGENNLDFEVKAIDFISYLKDLGKDGIRPYLIKLDIEGAEFDVLNAILDAGLNDSFDYLVCETHERFFEDGDKRINQLKGRLRSGNVNNIFLDWA